MRFLRKLGEILLAGLLTLLPVYLTIQVLVMVFGFLDKEVGAVLEPIFGRHVPGAGIVTTFLVVLMAGLFTRWWLTRRLLGLVDLAVQRVPGLGLLYSTIKRLLDPLSRREDKPFREAVWVPVGNGLLAMGFITSGTLDAGTDPEGRVSVYLPSCHPYLGMVTVARRSDLLPAPVQLDEAVTFQFSFGASPPPGIVRGHDGNGAPPNQPDGSAEVPAP